MFNKRLFALASLALMLPVAALANSSVGFTDVGGTLITSHGILSLSGSALVAVNGLNGSGWVKGADLGTVSFTTGALISGSVKHGGQFAGGGSFTITGSGSNGVPAGAIFTGEFSGPVTLTLFTEPSGTHKYTLSGVVSGTLVGGPVLRGVTTQLTINTGKGYFDSKAEMAGGEGNLSTVAVPEPGTMGLLGTGLLAIGWVVRRKFHWLG